MKLNNNEIDAIIRKYNKKHNWNLSNDVFINHAKRYIKAIKEGRMICSIGSVSSSGMSRTIKFLEIGKVKTYDKETRYSLSNFYQFFEALEYSKAKNDGYFRIGGCGMDMIFHTNYSIINKLGRLGFMDKKACDTLAQRTPPIV